MRVPRLVRIIEGTGTALGRSGRVLPLEPVMRVPAGSRVSGGPFVIELLAVARRTGMKTLVAWCIFAGIVAGFATDAIVTFAGA